MLFFGPNSAPNSGRISPSNPIGSREFESPLSAKQSAIFAFSAEISKIVRMFAHFLVFKGTGEAHIRSAAEMGIFGT
jgi:hypothetical protein